MDDSYLARYHQTFDALPAEISKLLAREEKESFADSATAQLLFEVYYGGERAGLVAAEPSELFGTSGFVVREEILAAHMRGKGLGPQIQAALAKRVFNHAGRLLHGTIHEWNDPSLRTALRAGRKIIGCHGFWITAESTD